MQVVPDLHLEGIEKENFSGKSALPILKDLMRTENKNVVISIPPWMPSEEWQRENPRDASALVEHLKNLFQKNGNTLGQQGNAHKCKYGHRFADPWHENACLYWPNPSREEQREFMERGREKLEKIFDVTPCVYVPPNHLHDENTLEVAAKMGYKAFMIKAILNVKPYRFNEMLVIPEEDMLRGGLDRPAAYIHYDQIDRAYDCWQTALQNSMHFSDITPKPQDRVMNAANFLALRTQKIARDLLRLRVTYQKNKARNNK